jgi:Fibronectin type III domain
MHNQIQHACIRTALAVAWLAFVLGGCGGGGDSKSSSATPTSSTAPSNVPTEPATIPDTPTSPIPTAPDTGTTPTATLQWSAPQAMTDGSTVSGIVGYRVYYGHSVTQMNSKIDVMNPSVSTYVVEGLTPGTYYFSVTALHSSGGESDRSNAGMKVIT